MDYKQLSNQGCLVIDLLYLFGIEPSTEIERDILTDGLFRVRENYTLGCLLAFLDRYPDAAITMYVSNKYFLGKLNQLTGHRRLQLTYRKNDHTLLEELGTPFIAYIDNHITDGYTHLSHYLLATNSSDKFYTVFDPWTGKISKLSKTKLIHGIDLLRSHVKICPFIIVAS